MQEVCSPTRRRYWLLALFLFLMLGFAFYRHSSFAVWNDSSSLFHPRSSNETGGWDVMKEHFAQDPLGTLGVGVDSSRGVSMSAQRGTSCVGRSGG